MSEKDENLKFIFVAGTRATEELFQELPLGRSLSILRKIQSFEECIFYRNNEGLPRIYNEAIHQYREKYSNKTCILIFVHDDVWINDVFLFEKLLKARGEFNIVGLAGTSGKLCNRPISWWNSLINTQSGAVAHPLSGNQYCFCYYGVTPQWCNFIDGLFIAVDLQEVLKAEVTFDEDPLFKFDFYDLSFCKRAISAGLTIGTWPIWCSHDSKRPWPHPGIVEAEARYFEKYSRCCETV